MGVVAITSDLPKGWICLFWVFVVTFSVKKIKVRFASTIA